MVSYPYHHSGNQPDPMTGPATLAVNNIVFKGIILSEQKFYFCINQKILPMKNLFYILVCSIILFTGCSGNTENSQEAGIVQGMMELDLSQYGMNMTMLVPDSTVGTLEVTAQSYGDVEIRVGNYFQIKIAPGGDLALKKIGSARWLEVVSPFLHDCQCGRSELRGQGHR
jgi:hypothetical protein